MRRSRSSRSRIKCRTSKSAGGTAGSCKFTSANSTQQGRLSNSFHFQRCLRVQSGRHHHRPPHMPLSRRDSQSPSGLSPQASSTRLNLNLVSSALLMARLPPPSIRPDVCATSSARMDALRVEVDEAVAELHLGHRASDDVSAQRAERLLPQVSKGSAQWQTSTPRYLS